MHIKIDQQQYYVYTATHLPDANKETIVFVHGASMDHSVWCHQSRYFAYHGYNVIAPDLPGHKLSAGKLLHRIEDMSAWLAAIMAQFSGTAMHLVGHSMGALVALQTAANYGLDMPLKTLSLVGFSYPMRVTPQLMDAAKNDPSAAFSMMTQWSHTSKVGGEPTPGLWSAGMQMSMMENSGEGTIYADLQACDNYSGGQDALQKTNCPILFISGQQDKMAPSKLAVQEVEVNQQAEILLIPNCGHSVMSESPHGVLEALKSFIYENSGSVHA